MGYIFDFNDSQVYKKWHDDPANQLMIQSQLKLLFDMLNPAPDNSILDIGCGIGTHLDAFIKKGLDTTGIEPSPCMIDIASEKVGNKAIICKGICEDLPFEDNSFNYSSLITILEFVNDPSKAIEEACRVTKDKVFIGILNKYAVKNIERRIKSVFSDTIYKKARFFAIWEINHIIKSLMGDIPIIWRTVDYDSTDSALKKKKLEALLRKNPFSAFVGITAILNPSFRTTPISLKSLTKNVAGAFGG